MSTLVAGGVRVEYSEIGLGQPVVMIHSAPGTEGQWRVVAESLKDAFRILAVNLHGIGETQPWPGPGHMGVDDDARLVRAVATASGTPFHLVGHSYGGAVAIRVALSSPARLQSLTLIEPMVYPLLRWTGDDALYSEAVSVVEPFLVAPMGDAAEAAWRQGTDRYHGAGWELPGGRVEQSEDLLDALAREVREETGCEIEVGRLTPTSRCSAVAGHRARWTDQSESARQ